MLRCEKRCRQAGLKKGRPKRTQRWHAARLLINAHHHPSRSYCKTEPRRNAVPWRTESSDTWVARAPIVVDLARGCRWVLARALGLVPCLRGCRNSGSVGYAVKHWVRWLYDNCKFPVFSPSLSPFLVCPFSSAIINFVMVNWQNPVTITHELSALAPIPFRLYFPFFFYNSCRRARQIFTRRRRDLSVRLFSSRSNRERADNHPRGSWEFICNLGFEWGLVSGRRQWRWTIAVSSASFLTSLPRPCVFHVGQRVFPNSFTLPLGWLPSPMY